MWTLGTPSGSGGLRPRRRREERVGVWARGAEDVKYEGESGSESSEESCRTVSIVRDQNWQIEYIVGFIVVVAIVSWPPPHVFL